MFVRTQHDAGFDGPVPLRADRPLPPWYASGEDVPDGAGGTRTKRLLPLTLHQQDKQPGERQEKECWFWLALILSLSYFLSQTMIFSVLPTLPSLYIIISFVLFFPSVLSIYPSLQLYMVLGPSPFLILIPLLSSFHSSFFALLPP